MLAVEAPIRNWLIDAGPKTLAALRIAVSAGTVTFAIGNRAFVVPPEGLRFPPAGTAWLDFLPVSQSLYVLGVAAAAGGGVLLAIGLRRAAWLALAGLFYAGWVTTLTGKVDHPHHLMWLLLVLAVSPCCNIWSVRREARTGSYQWPAMATIVVLGLVYFGAGLQKFTSEGLAWGWSDNLANTMVRLGLEKGQPIHEWLIDWPLAGKILGLGALVFELAFLPLMLHPKTRRLWPVGLVFHWGTWWLLGIPFLALQFVYVVFLPWDHAEPSDVPTPAQRRVLVGLVAAVAVFAVLGLDRAWPVAAYPGFAGVQQPVVDTFEVTVDGEEMFVSELDSPLGRQRIHHLIALALHHGRTDEIEAWLGVDSITPVQLTP